MYVVHICKPGYNHILEVCLCCYIVERKMLMSQSRQYSQLYSLAPPCPPIVHRVFPTKPEEIDKYRDWTCTNYPEESSIWEGAWELSCTARGTCVHSFTKSTGLCPLSLELWVGSLQSQVSMQYRAIFHKVRRKEGREEKRTERGRGETEGGGKERGREIYRACLLNSVTMSEAR